MWILIVLIAEIVLVAIAFTTEKPSGPTRRYCEYIAATKIVALLQVVAGLLPYSAVAALEPAILFIFGGLLTAWWLVSAWFLRSAPSRMWALPLTYIFGSVIANVVPWVLCCLSYDGAAAPWFLFLWAEGVLGGVLLLVGVFNRIVPPAQTLGCGKPHVPEGC